MLITNFFTIQNFKNHVIEMIIHKIEKKNILGLLMFSIFQLIISFKFNFYIFLIH